MAIRMETAYICINCDCLFNVEEQTRQKGKTCCPVCASSQTFPWAKWANKEHETTVKAEDFFREFHRMLQVA